MKANETLDWQAADLPKEFYTEVVRRDSFARQKKNIEKVIGDIDDYLTVQLKLAGQKSVKVGEVGTVGIRTNTNTRIDPDLLMKEGVTVGQIERATVRTESKEYVQIYPKPKPKAVKEGDDSDGE